VVGKQWAGTTRKLDRQAAQAFGTLIKEMMGVAAHRRGVRAVMQQAMIADGTLACTPKPNFGGEKSRMWNAIARPVGKRNRAHKMEWPGPRTYLDDVPLQLRLLSRFLRAAKSDLGAWPL
jgi:hypothetical protein